MSGRRHCLQVNEGLPCNVLIILLLLFPILLLASHVTTVGHVSPEPKNRQEMLKCESVVLHYKKQNTAHSCFVVFTKIHPLLLVHFEPTMDPNTVYRHVMLSDGGRKATMRSENLNPPEHPERFQFWRQVLCREALAGSPYYWEVEWTGHKVNSYTLVKRKVWFMQ